MKKLFVLAGAALVSLSMNAQRLDVGVNLMMGLPMGDYNIGEEEDAISLAPGFGLGGGIEANYWFNDAISVGIEVGFISFGEKVNDIEGLDYKAKATAIPIILKGQYYFLDDEFRPYVGLGVGYGIVSREASAEIPFFGTSTTSWQQNGLIISPRVGALYQLTDMLALNLSVQFNLLMNAVDGDLEMTTEIAGQEETETVPDMQVDATNYLGINLGVVITLFD